MRWWCKLPVIPSIEGCFDASQIAMALKVLVEVDEATDNYVIMISTSI